MTTTWCRRTLSTAMAWVTAAIVVAAHDGPPFPIVSNQTAGPYIVSVWTDPDTTDDGTAGGQFWVMAKVAGSDEGIPAATRARVTITPIDRAGMSDARATEPVDGDVDRQFAALVMDHEGRFGVRVDIDGPLGQATVEADVEATYDTRPPPVMVFIYLVPFLLVGGLWVRAMSKRRQRAA